MKIDWKDPKVIGGTAAGVAVVAGLGWAGWRFRQRAQLRDLLAMNPEVAVLGTPEDLAAEEMGIFSTTSVEEAYSDIVARIPAPQIPLIEQVSEVVQRFVPEDVTKEGTEFSQSLWEAGKSWWEGK